MSAADTSDMCWRLPVAWLWVVEGHSLFYSKVDKHNNGIPA